MLVILGLVIVGCSSTPPPASEAQGTGPSASSTAPSELPSGPTGPQQASSYELIQDALERGAIDDEQALLYSVFAAFGDPRLPAEFAAPPSEDFEPPVDFTRVAAAIDGFSPDIRDQLIPFLIPPMHSGSWWDLRHNSSASAGFTAGMRVAAGSADPLRLPILDEQWSSVLTQNERVRIWYPAGDVELFQLANATREEIDFVIWPRLVALMGIEPLPDLGLTGLAHGSDDALDMVLQNETGWAMTAGRAPNLCERTAAWILLDPRIVAKLEVPWNSAVAHELMHAFQFALDVALLEGGPDGCSSLEYVWWSEATATWVEDYVYPGSNSEWSGERGERHVREFMTTLDRRLGGSGPFSNRFVPSRPYGAYLFAFYIARRFGDGIVAESWRRMAALESEPAIDQAIASFAPTAGGLKRVWGEFALAVLNEEPFDFFAQEDGVAHTPLGFARQSLAINESFGEVDHQIRLGTDYEAIGEQDGFLRVDWSRGSGTGLQGLAALASTYVHYTFPDPNVRSIGWYNGVTHTVETVVGDSGSMWTGNPRPPDEIDGLQVQALIRIEGQEWILEDWTDYPWRTFCRDAQGERLEELIVIVSNGRSDDRFLESPAYDPDNNRDSRIWASDMGCYRWQGSVHMEQHSGAFHLRIDVEDLVLERLTESGGPMGVNGAIPYAPVQGQMRWTLSNSLAPCIQEGNGTSAIDRVQAVSTFNYFLEGAWYRSAGGGLNGTDGTDIPITCDGEPQEPYHFVPLIPLPADGSPSRLEDGRHWTGRSVNGDVVVSWDLVAVAE